MNNETPQSNEPGGSNKPLPKAIWLLLALTPAVIIMLAVGSGHGGGSGDTMFVTFWLNPAVACIGCYGLLNRPDRTKVIPIVGGLFLGALFALFNIMVGVFCGCAFGGGHSF